MPNFNILNFATDFINNKIVIEFTLHLDKTTVNFDKVIVIDGVTRKMPKYKIEIQKTKMNILFEEDPVPNRNYEIRILDGVRSAFGDYLEGSWSRGFVFKSSIDSTIEIISPSDFEVMEELNIKWKEIIKKEKNSDRFKIEISKENVFFNNPIITSTFNKDSIILSDLEDGQYYLRMRAESESEYGEWSETISFIIKKKQIEEELPVFFDDLVFSEVPENGTQSDIFKFKVLSDVVIDRENISIVKRGL